MLQAFVLNDVAYAAKIGGGTISGINQLNLLAPGALAIFASDNALIDVTSPAGELVDKKAVYFAIGKFDSSGAQRTQTINRNELTNYTAKSYLAPVAEKQFLGNDGAAGALNLPTLVTGQEWEVVVFDETKGGHNYNVSGRKAFRYNGLVGNTATAAAVIPAIVAKINADTDRIVDAAVIGANVGISLTAREVTTTFQLAASGILEDADVTFGGDSNSLPYKPGIGTYAQVVEIMDIAEGEFGRGHGGQLADKWWKFKSNVSVSGTYDSYIFNFSAKRFDSTGNNTTTANEVIIFLPAAPATFPQTAFQTTMGVIFGTDTSDAIESGDDTA